MKTVPRASLCITILRDEEYVLLMGSRGGAEAFGVFAALLILGRERFQESKARRLSDSDEIQRQTSESTTVRGNSLRFDESQRHLSIISSISLRQLSRTLETFADVARRTGNRPWIYLDDTEHLVIRSFFKFNVADNWGGARKGAGRPPSSPSTSRNGSAP